MSETIRTSLYLVRLGLFTDMLVCSDNGCDFSKTNWGKLFCISVSQDVNAIAADGLQLLLENPDGKELLKSLDAAPLKLQKMQWLGSSLTIERI